MNFYGGGSSSDDSFAQLIADLSSGENVSKLQVSLAIEQLCFGATCTTQDRFEQARAVKEGDYVTLFQAATKQLPTLAIACYDLHSNTLTVYRGGATAAETELDHLDTLNKVLQEHNLTHVCVYEKQHLTVLRQEALVRMLHDIGAARELVGEIKQKIEDYPAVLRQCHITKQS